MERIEDVMNKNEQVNDISNMVERNTREDLNGKTCRLTGLYLYHVRVQNI
jgi:hypothetical protein